MPAMNLSAVILAGGESHRMGRNKAWLELDGQPLILRAIAAVRGLEVRELFISARSPQDYARLEYPILLDQQPNCGPLGGILRGLEAAASPGLLVLAVDLPHMTISFLKKLAARCTDSTGVVPRLNGRLEPLAAIYPKSCKVIAQRLIQESRFAATEFAEDCLRQHLVRAYRVAPPDIGCLANWNSPLDFPAAREISHGAGA
jgi:molybdenum cofactor guanylyltransferase